MPTVNELMGQQWPPPPPRPPAPMQPVQPVSLPQPQAPTPAEPQQRAVDRSHRGASVGRVQRDPHRIADSNRKQTKVWTDHNGCMYRICDIEDQMLAGILRMMKRSGCVLRTFRLVELLDGNDPTLLQTDDTLVRVAHTDWREFVPMPEMFVAMEADWHRRGLRQEQWDTEAANSSDAIHTFRTQVVDMIDKLSKPETATAVKGRADRSINL